MGLPIVAALPVVGKIIEGVLSVIDQAIEDKDKAAVLKHEVTMKILDNEQALMQGQLDINKIEAASEGNYKGGWRPFIGWVCGFALFWNFMGYDLINWMLTFLKTFYPVLANIDPPALVGSDNLIEVVFAMLGLAGFRSFEKWKGAAK